MTFHLILVTLSAFYIPISDELPGKRIIDLYRRASGANSTYGFFAPSLGGKTRAVVDIIEDNGRTIVDLPLVKNAGREVDIRLGSLSDEFIRKDEASDETRKQLAASLAAATFSNHPNAKEVMLRIQEFWPISMDEYRRGLRAHWQDYYAARFARTDDHNSIGAQP